ncbi:MAG: DinB family protein [Bacteroidetes bacterium]|nr:DinB family protein [Fibrella sp.]
MWPENQYALPGTTLTDALTRLRQHIDQLPVQLSALSVSALQQPRQPGKWSRQEVVGHLIDSALNNLRRFTEAQFSPQPYRTQSYAQEELVRVNHYGTMPPGELLALWQALNRQILRVASTTPADKLSQAIAFPGTDEIRTLSWLIEDYVAHLEHHLDQLR